MSKPAGQQPESSLQSIPHPPDKWLIGNALDISSESQVQDLMRLAREYGGIFYLSFGGRRTVIVSSFELVDELCDESRFDKRVWAPLLNVREFAGDGLFTAHTFEPNWEKAHNILLPNFSLAAMKRYHPMMLDVARQMFDRWERLNPQEEIDVTDQMTRLTLDTIGLCGFDYRFNSFYKERMDPFIRAMTRAMSIAMDRSARPIPRELFFRQNKRFQRAVAHMNKTVDRIIQERRRVGVDLSQHSDLLAHMLVGQDRETGETLDDLNIRYQIITFLIAGHETTSGLLSFTTYFLLQHPEVLEKATEEALRVLGPDPTREPTYRQVTELRYIRQVLNESLRLWPTAPMFSLFPKEGRTVIGGRYEIDKRDAVAVLVPMLHRDSNVWGDRAEHFDPEHFSPEAESARPANAYKPFGNGQRACIGRQFAMHEATLAIGMMLQRFEIVDHTRYDLDIKETLTLKPQKLSIRVRRREPVATTKSEPTEEPVETVPAAPTEVVAAQQHDTPMWVLYGSNMGTAEALARRIADDAEKLGFDTTLAPLDDFAGRLPKEGPVLLVSSSYNGTPPDNATRFCRWLEEQPADGGLEGVRYAVFGCGHRDWASTYQKVPKTLDRLLADAGAERLYGRGEGDGGGDFDGDFEAWYQPFWAEVARELDLQLDAGSETREHGPLFEVEVVDDHHPNPFVTQFGARPMVVVENRELQSADSERSTRHLELALPPGVSYETGDHLGVVAQNDPALVHRVVSRFGFDEQTRVRIHNRAAGHTDFPTGQTISVVQLLTDYVELQDPATRSQIKTMADHTGCPPDKKALLELCGDDDESQARYREKVLEPRKSVLDLLEDFHACELPFGVYLSLLPPLRPRYYSISSSPLTMDRICSITVGVVQGEARSGRGLYKGTCSNYLAQKKKGSVVYAFVRDTSSSFRLPRSAATPIVMIGPGTGIAPFRGFLQERAARRERGLPQGDAMLFFGCRRRDEDYLYRDELEDWVASGVVRLFCAFSREDPDQKVYVQHRLREHADAVWDLIEAGAVVYVCGDASAMAPDVRKAFLQIHRTRTGSSEEDSRRWMEEMEGGGRYLVDVWASG